MHRSHNVNDTFDSSSDVISLLHPESEPALGPLGVNVVICLCVCVLTRSRTISLGQFPGTPPPPEIFPETPRTIYRWTFLLEIPSLGHPPPRKILPDNCPDSGY